MSYILLVSLLLILQQAVVVNGELLVHFYNTSCPRAELIVREIVKEAFEADKNSSAKLLRLFFHDCFVRGCDASILLDAKQGSNGTEKNATRNLSVGGYEIIDAAKEKLELVCAKTVSCADIIAMAARDAVVMTAGPDFDMPTGRRDGLISIAHEVSLNIPDPSANVDQLLSAFIAKGLSISDIVVLSGAHTIGFARCGAFSERLVPTVDNTLDPGFAHLLISICGPNPSSNSTIRAPLDTSSTYKFDNAYYHDLQNGKGLITSDQVLFLDSRTRWLVRALATDEHTFFVRFQLAMVKMGGIGVQTGTNGQIRRSCRTVNES